MDLKQKISSLRKENQSLTKAFIWLCSGTADWDTLIQQLPQHVSQQLPVSGPPLLTPAPSHSCLSVARPPSSSPDRFSGLPTRPYTPASARPQTCQSTPVLAEVSAEGTFRTPPRTAPASRQSSTMLRSKSGHPWLTEMPPSTAQENLLQFPALAALESEFQALFSQPATAAQEYASGCYLDCSL